MSAKDIVAREKTGGVLSSSEGSPKPNAGISQPKEGPFHAQPSIVGAPQRRRAVVQRARTRLVTFVDKGEDKEDDVEVKSTS